MPTYKYVAVNMQKRKYKGIFIAEDENDLAVQLIKQNLFLVSSKVYKEGTPSAFFTMGTGKVKISEITTFCRQFAIMLSTGIQLLDCIDNLKHQPFTGYFRSILQVISEDVRGGMMLSQSLDKHKKVFPDFFRSMVHVGEASGKLDSVFVSLADYYETSASIKRKVKSAMSYPLILACMTVGIVILMLAFIVPTFRKTLSSMDVEVTGITRAVYGVSDFLLMWWPFLLLGVIVLAGATFLFLQTQTGKRAFDVFKVRCPMVGKVQTNMITARFARAFGLLLSSGMDLASALDTTSIIIGNIFVRERFDEAAEDIRQGVSLTNAFLKQNIFPRMMIQMLSVGEQTASLEQVLSRSCLFFDEMVETSLTSLTAKIQPIMLMIMGSVIAVLFIAVYSPMLSIMTALG